MAIILDSDVIIRGEKGSFDLRRWLTLHPNEPLGIAAITVAELWHGVERASGKHKAIRQEYLESIVGPMPIFPYTEQTAYHHARIWTALESSGKMIGDYDVVIAATALERGSTVATFNLRHFSRVKGLKVIEPEVGD